MGQKFAFQIWVPRAQLYEATVVLAERANTPAFAAKSWPDGRPLSPSSDAEDPDYLGFSGFHLLGISFPADEKLRDYQKKNRGIDLAYVRQHNAAIWREHKEAHRPNTLSQWFQRLIGKGPPIEAELPAHLRAKLWDEAEFESQRDRDLINLWPFEVTFNDWFEGREWIDGERELALIELMGANSAISGCMAYSDSVQAWFVALARDVGAYSCAIDYLVGGTATGTLLYFDGAECDSAFDQSESYSPFSLAPRAGRSQSENARRMSELARLTWNNELTPEQQEQLLCATRDENSGIRAKALKVMVELGGFPTREILRAALNDSDARVRELAVALYAGDFPFDADPNASDVAPLLRLLHGDPSEAVRLQAVRSLGNFPVALDTVHDILTRASEPHDWAMVQNALSALHEMGAKVSDEERIAILRAALARPDLAAREWAQVRLDTLEAWAPQ